MTRLPLTVIAGYLGAGKTTLINRLLAEDHGLKLLIMVNDFGAINIDAELLTSAEKDTMTLTNGCVCCTMGADLFLALGDALDRRPRPDHVLIEASGIANPGQIANAAIAEPEMDYGGIVTVVDAQAFEALCDDALIGPQIRGQVAQSDLILISKTGSPENDLTERLRGLSGSPALALDTTDTLGGLLLGKLTPTGPTVGAGVPHPDYVSWSCDSDVRMAREEIESCLRNRPAGLYRVKGIVRGHGADDWEVQAVGSRASVTKAAPGTRTRIVGIGPSARTNRSEIEHWWTAASEKAASGTERG